MHPYFQHLEDDAAQHRGHLQELINGLIDACQSDDKDCLPVILHGEKDSAANLLIKLSQLLLKWSEMELSIAKEHAKYEASHPQMQAHSLSHTDIELAIGYATDIQARRKAAGD